MRIKKKQCLCFSKLDIVYLIMIKGNRKLVDENNFYNPPSLYMIKLYLVGKRFC